MLFFISHVSYVAFDAPALLLVLLGDVEGHGDFCAPLQSWTAVRWKLLTSKSK